VRRVTRYALVSLVLLTTVNCASTPASAPASTQLTRVGEAVQITENAMSARECEYVIELPVENTPTENDLRALRNEAGNRGSNLVLMLRGSAGQILRAEGYLCAD
jgi:hypothetical protein